MKATTSSRRGGFTLVELLAVVTIIIILAGVVIGGMGLVKDRQNASTAKIQLALLASALEQYKLDNGSYPMGDEGSESDSNILFRALYWGDSENNEEGGAGAGHKIYLNELDPDNNKQGWLEGSGADTKIVDPWGNEYHYRPGTLPNGKPNLDAWNPDFDLWSSGKDGKTSKIDEKHEDNQDDIKNPS